MTGSIRGRLGYALDYRWLVYGTAGVAFAHEKQTRDQYRYSEDIMGKASSSLFFVDQLSGMRTGVTVGGGVEYAINDRWSVMADYTYSRFGNRSFSFENARAGTGATTRPESRQVWKLHRPNRFFVKFWEIPTAIHPKSRSINIPTTQAARISSTAAKLPIHWIHTP